MQLRQDTVAIFNLTRNKKWKSLFCFWAAVDIIYLFIYLQEIIIFSEYYSAPDVQQKMAHYTIR